MRGGGEGSSKKRCGGAVLLMGTNTMIQGADNVLYGRGRWR